MRVNRQYTHQGAFRATAGFTLFEITIVTLIIGILSAIAAPSWISLVNRQHLNMAQEQIYRAMQEAKSSATLQKVTWQTSFQENNGVVQWAVHPAESGTFIPAGVKWNNLPATIQVYKDKNDKGKCETTLDQQSQNCSTNGPWRVQFNYIGNTNGQLGQLTLTTKNNSNLKRCIYVSTLIGNIRMGKEHSKPNSSDKYCY
jgi:prepilin-type N-terminal cleavage/methylation domain-containing protein